MPRKALRNRTKPKKLADSYPRRNYLLFIKGYCVSCGNQIPKTWENYLIRGNYCIPCNKVADQKAEKITDNTQIMIEVFKKLVE